MKRLVADRRGAVTILAALALLAMMASAAFAVDLGSLYLARRQLQGVADAAALAAARTPSDPAGAARRTVSANGIDATLSAFASGNYAADTTRPSADRFSTGGGTDAARLTLAQDMPLFFGRILSERASVRLTASATAARIDYAAFSIGSRLAGVSGGVPGALLSALAGTSIALSAMDYQALARADIDMLAFADALAARAGVSAGSYGDALAVRATLPQAVGAMADALAAAGGDAAAVAALRSLSLTLPANAVRMGDLIDAGPFATQDHAAPGTRIAADAFSMLREMLLAAGGARQASLDLPVGAGLASARLVLAVGERAAHSPWLAVARDGSVVVRTAQTRLYLDARLPGAAALGLVSLRLPLYVELAAARAKLAAISCAGGPAAATVTLSVSPSIGSAAIADIDAAKLGDFSSPIAEARAVVAHALVADVTGQAHVAVGGDTWQPVAFSAADIAGGVTRTVSTGDTAQAIAASLARSIDLRVAMLGVGLPLPTAPVGAALSLAAPAVDALLNQTLAALGVGLGQADVRVDGVRCGRPTLVA